MELISSHTFPDQHTAAKRVFDTVDVLDLILDHFDPYRDRSSLARLARTRTACFRPSISRLWKRLNSFRPLIGLLPKHVLAHRLQTFSTTTNEDEMVPTPRDIRDDDFLRWQIYSPFVRTVAVMPCLLSETITTFNDHDDMAVLKAIFLIGSLLGTKALPNLTELMMGSLTSTTSILASRLKTSLLTSIILNPKAVHGDVTSVLGFLSLIDSWKQIKKLKVITLISNRQMSNELTTALFTILHVGIEQLESFSLRSHCGHSVVFLPGLNNLPLLSQLALSDNWSKLRSSVYDGEASFGVLHEVDACSSQTIRQTLGSGAFHCLTGLAMESSPAFCAAMLDVVRGPLSRVTIRTTFTALEELRALIVSIVGSQHQPRRDLKHLSLTFQNCWNAFPVDSCWAVLFRLQPLDLRSFDLEGTFYDDSAEDHHITEQGISYLISQWHNLRHLHIETMHKTNHASAHPMQKIVR
ncbi:hypothetical protein CALVIDRAFT_537636 [Calocera viscosa TUFC12733]|uniref:F-box domain-containing protein n=1 Tax=Calocera viscosa (strain TUFC12733) TaxID=1330018 RepID=A0A167LUS1_CALVF|nr:hypothetical protein CALVIDRAFT_537636 [Calocera viscosa TUFC12733]